MDIALLTVAMGVVALTVSMLVAGYTLGRMAVESTSKADGSLGHSSAVSDDSHSDSIDQLLQTACDTKGRACAGLVIYLHSGRSTGGGPFGHWGTRSDIIEAHTNEIRRNNGDEIARQTAVLLATNDVVLVGQILLIIITTKTTIARNDNKPVVLTYKMLKGDQTQ